ncbi:MAG: hypothetical protein KDB88_01735 [Flavobacteriales bacterium]|nr:hypothetical protein [Flavobacteriales bacterium]
MRTVLLIAIVLATQVVGWAQCQIQNFQIAADCANDAPEASMSLTGGVPPYQLTFTGSNGISAFDQSAQDGFFTSPIGDFWLTILLSPVQLTVTDANGCTASASASYQEHLLALPDVWFERDCASTMSRLFWSGTYTHPVPGTLADGQPDPCSGASYDYEIVDSQTWNTVASGAVADDWSQFPNGFWQYSTPMPNGFYYVSIHPTFNPIGCQNGPFAFCYREKGAVTDLTPAGCGQAFQLKVLLAGPYNGASDMFDELRVNGLVPLTEPYSALGYSYVGSSPGQTIPASVLATSGSNAIVDWVVVELRDKATPNNVLHSMPALLQRDGDVVVNGSTLLRPPLGPDLYQVAIRHRNHLGAMTANAQWLGITPGLFSGYTILDFRTAALPTHGTDARRAIGSWMCLWPGDATFDGVVKYAGANNDRDAILQVIGGSVPTATISGQYLPEDINLDGVVKYAGANNDRDVVLQTIGGVVPTATRLQQLP